MDSVHLKMWIQHKLGNIVAICMQGSLQLYWVRLYEFYFASRVHVVVVTKFSAGCQPF